MNEVMYNAVMQYYQLGLFTQSEVKSMVGTWITQDECNTILGATGQTTTTTTN